MASEAIEYHQEVRANEVRTLEALAQDPSIRAMFNDDEGPTLIEYATGSSLPSTPRPSLALLKDVLDAYYPLQDTREQIQPFVSATLLPLAGLPQASDPFPGTMIFSEAEACSDAEVRFTEALEQAKGTGEQCHDRISVYHDDAGRPLALRKQANESTALTLVPVSIEETVFPAGTIVGISHQHAATSGDTTVNGCLYTTYRVDNALEIAPKRIGAAAYSDPSDRALFAITTWGQLSSGNRIFSVSYEEGTAAALTAYDIDDYREAACQVMTLCGVDNAAPLSA